MWPLLIPALLTAGTTVYSVKAQTSLAKAQHKAQLASNASALPPPPATTIIHGSAPLPSSGIGWGLGLGIAAGAVLLALLLRR